MGDDVQALVVDNGSGMCKAGMLPFLHQIVLFLTFKVSLEMMLLVPSFHPLLVVHVTKE
jgi:hypothetical protein